MYDWCHPFGLAKGRTPASLRRRATEYIPTPEVTSLNICRIISTLSGTRRYPRRSGDNISHAGHHLVMGFWPAAWLRLFFQAADTRWLLVCDSS